MESADVTLNMAWGVTVGGNRRWTPTRLNANLVAWVLVHGAAIANLDQVDVRRECLVDGAVSLTAWR